MPDVGLLLIHDATEHATWLHTWAHSYPETAQVFVKKEENHQTWQTQIQAAYNNLHTQNVAIVAHGMGVWATLAWYDSLHLTQHRHLSAILLVEPIQAALGGEMTKVAQRTRFTPKTALICAHNSLFCTEDWAHEQAKLWHARLFVLPPHFNPKTDDFEWGMRLLQEMVL